MYSTLIIACMALCAAAVPVAAPKPQLLNDLSPDVAALISGLGLADDGAVVGGILDILGSDIKKRQLLNDLSPDVEALLAGLGLADDGATVAGILNTLGSDIKKRSS